MRFGKSVASSPLGKPVSSLYLSYVGVPLPLISHLLVMLVAFGQSEVCCAGKYAAVAMPDHKNGVR